MKKGLIALSLLVASNTTAQTCIPKPDCADMGYTETSCNGGALKCPFDTTKLFCTSSLPPAVECDVGMIYYSNGKCYSEYSTSYGIALGVVVVGDSLVMGTPSSIDWCPVSKSVDIPSIPNLPFDGATGDMDGKAHTLAIVAQYENTSGDVAGVHCNNLALTGTKAGDWYLPASGELYVYVYRNYNILQSAFDAMGWNMSKEFWSSSESSISSGSNAMYVIPKTGRISYDDKYVDRYVSCFLEI